MPTSSGGETVQERLTRLRIELARVRQTIERSEVNGSTFALGGVQVTQVAYERACQRERKLEAEIESLEARMEGRSTEGRAIIHSRQ